MVIETEYRRVVGFYGGAEVRGVHATGEHVIQSK